MTISYYVSVRLVFFKLALTSCFVGRPNALQAMPMPRNDTLAQPAQNNSFEKVGAAIERRFFVWLSDAHMDPYYGRVKRSRPDTDAAVCTFGCNGDFRTNCQIVTKNFTSENPFGAHGCDPPVRLFDISVRSAAKRGRGARFVLYTGDAARHGQHLMPNPRKNVTMLMRHVGRTLQKEFRSLKKNDILIGSLGNDDSPSDYYLSVTNSSVKRNPWLGRLADGMRLDKSMTPARAKRYARGGFYEAKIDNLRILTLNTIIYSVKHTPPSIKKADPFNQFRWLRARLLNAHKHNLAVWIVGHVPPTLETFGFTSLWHEKYVLKYLKLVQDSKLAKVIAAQLFGHVHADEFRLLPNAPPGAGPVLLTGSISPIYNCNPSYRLVEYDARSGRLLNFKVYSAQLPEAAGGKLKFKFGYDLLGAYGSTFSTDQGRVPLTNADFERLAHNLFRSWKSGGKEFQHYATWYKTRVINDLECVSRHMANESKLGLPERRRFMGRYMCALKHWVSRDFKECSRDYVLRNASVETSPVNLSAGDDSFSDSQRNREMSWRRISRKKPKSVAAFCEHMAK